MTAPGSALFAALARRALRPLAIGPRLPSRFETPAAASAAFQPAFMSTSPADAAGEQASRGPAAARGHLQKPDTAPVAMPAAPGGPGGARSPDASTPDVRAAAPMQAPLLADAGSALPRAATPDAPAGDARYATPARAIAAATAQLAPLVVTVSAAAAHTQAASAAPGEAAARPRHAADARPAAAMPIGLAPQRFAALERLDAPTRVDGIAATAITPAAGKHATSSPPPPPAPRVDITIGSIDVVFTSAPAPAAAPRPPAAAAPAVQSLDDYLQSRQRRGGPR